MLTGIFETVNQNVPCDTFEKCLDFWKLSYFKISV